MSFEVEYRNITDRSLGFHARSRPSVPAPVRRVTERAIGGRDGSFYDTDNFFDDIAIPITFSFTKKDRSQWFTMYRTLKKWALSSELGNLKFSDDPGFHYIVRNVRITTTERIAWVIGEVTVEFICDPFTYYDSGDNKIPLEASIVNPGETSHPIYEISGTGECTLTVNGKEFVVTVSGKVTIDTDKMLTFNSESMLANTTAEGDYQDLWLDPGDNSLSITSGYVCQIIPYWRCL